MEEQEQSLGDDSAAADSSTGVPAVVASDEQAPVLPFPVVGIGASAGGLEAFLELFRTLPTNTGMAFVIISHLAANRRSLLPEILGRATPMPVEQAQNAHAVKPDTIYVIPPGTNIRLEHGKIALRPRSDHERRPNKPVDEFFYSLADEQRGLAIGVVLSGTDSDGSLGLRAIKGEGGLALVQDEESARFEDMPRNAVAADNVDFILPPAEIGAELGRIARRLRDAPGKVPDIADTVLTDEEATKRIHRILRTTSGIDFSRYKQTTLRRRIARRLVVKRLEKAADYVTLLEKNPAEARQLVNEVLIGVTRFFRDPDTFEALKAKFLPLVLRDRSLETPIRIWVPGCSSGEEVYSIAMSLIEYLGHVPFQTIVQIFGTDVSEGAIERARLAIYPDSVVDDMSEERLRRFFVKVENGYQITKRIRELCVFARHDLGHDPPFSRLDLVSCRNVLIYFNAALQRNIIPMFHYSLRPTGGLLLGNSETIQNFSDLFSLYDRAHKFYLKNPTEQRVNIEFTPKFNVVESENVASEAKVLARDGVSQLDLQRSVDRVLLARYSPCGVLVSENLQVLLTRGDVSPYLTLPHGAVSLHVLRMAKEGLGATLQEALRRAMTDEVPVVFERVRLHANDGPGTIKVEVLPIATAPKVRTYLVLFFPELSDKQIAALRPEPMLPSTADEKDLEIAFLRQDLTSTKLYLQSLLEEREAKTQELISANEEIQSSNEELQSINEELETAKEELQSTNEELQTLNEELQVRNAELSHTSNDLANLFNSLTVPVLLLGPDLRIRQFTPLAERVMNVRSSDIGRPITEIRLNLQDVDLEPTLVEVLESLVPRELELKDRQGRWHLLRARPYRTSDNRIDGLVLVLIDIEQIRRAQFELQQAVSFSRAVLESVDVPLVVVTADLKIRLANPAFVTLSAKPRAEVEHAFIPDLALASWDMKDVAVELQDLLKRPPGASFTREHAYADDRLLKVHGRVIQPDEDFCVLLALQDMTDIRRAQSILESRVQFTKEALGRTEGELRRLAGRLITVQEDERRHIARELHDDVSQYLALVEMDLQRLEQHLTAGKPNPERQIVALRRQTGEFADSLRRVAHELHPRMLDELGLTVALKRLVDDFKKRGEIEPVIEIRHVPINIPGPVSACLYRVAQEALRNVAKHAGKVPVFIQLERVDSGGLRLVIADEGKGFDSSFPNSGEGLGVVSMYERMRLIGGVFSIRSKLGEGTTVTAEVPASVLT